MKIITYSKIAVLTWLATNIIAALTYRLAAALGIEFDPFLCSQCMTTLQMVLTFGAVFSAPASALVIMILFIIEIFRDAEQKLYAAILLLLIACGIVITAFIAWFGTDGFGYITVVVFLQPYVFASQFSFLLIARKFIFDNASTSHLTTK